MSKIPLALDRLLTPPVLYRDGSSYARLAATWHDPRAIPAEAAITAEIALLDSEAATASQQTNVVLADIRTRLQDVTGTAINDLTNAQLRDLVFALLFESGAIDRATATIKAPADWVQKPQE